MRWGLKPHLNLEFCVSFHWPWNFGYGAGEVGMDDYPVVAYLQLGLISVQVSFEWWIEEGD